MSAERKDREMDRRMDRQLRKIEARESHATPLRLAIAPLLACVVSLAMIAMIATISPKGALAAGADSLLEKGKAAGQVGEKLDGYIGLIDESAPENIKKMVKDTNERRKARYESIAKSRGTNVESVSKLAAAKILERVKPGQLFEGADGKWVEK